MWSPDLSARAWMPALTRIAGVIALAGLTAGCFQPLYGDRTVRGGENGIVVLV